MKYLCNICLWLTTLSSFSQEKVCNEFRTGVFKYSNPNYTEWTVKRFDSIQIETSNKTGIEIHSSIEWNTDCDYILTCQKVTDAKYQNIIGKAFQIFIVETSNKSYRCISKKNEVQLQDLELTMIKINEL